MGQAEWSVPNTAAGPNTTAIPNTVVGTRHTCQTKHCCQYRTHAAVPTQLLNQTYQTVLPLPNTVGADSSTRARGLACAMSDRLRTANGGVDQRRRTAATGQANDDLCAAGMRKGAAGSGRGDAGWGRRTWGRREKRGLRWAGANQACAALRPGGGSQWSTLSTLHAIT